MFHGHLDFFCELSVSILCPFFYSGVFFLLMFDVSVLLATKLLFSYVPSALQVFY